MLEQIIFCISWMLGFVIGTNLGFKIPEWIEKRKLKKRLSKSKNSIQ